MAEEVNVTQFLGLTGIDQLKGALGGGGDVARTIGEARTAIKPLLKDISDEFEKIGKKLKADISSALGSVGTDADGGAVTSARTKVVGGIDKAKAALSASSGGAAEGASSAAGISKIGTKMMGGLGKGAGMAAAGTAILGGINMGIDAANSRFARGREGVLEADRMSVLYQQMTGLSQLGVSSQYRMPLTNYRLGAGGINQMMAMEAQTGIRGTQQAASVEAMRTISGYQLSTADVTGMMGSLASAPTANRLFMMTGTGLIGPGGKQNSMMSVMQNIVRSAGLTDKDVLKNALLPGSVTRAKLTSMGVPQDMQTEVIQYAQQNLTYQQKGGKGMYDPSQEKARRLMGIEENFATQVEETQRLETKRDETFYRRQVDNYAALERQTQTLTRAFGALEDRLSGILGAVGQNRIATSIFQGVTGGGGDPDGQGGTGTNTSAPNVRSALNNPGFKQLHPKLKERVSKMLADNPNVGFGTGIRSASEQRSMFMGRYKKTDKPTTNGKNNVYWDGSYWEHVSGPAAAPPGRSMHEIGLAVDLTGDFDWVVKNAHKYGLKHFGDVNNEPWHVQPEELPNSRSAYEEGGAPWGRGPSGAAPFSRDSDFGETLDHPDQGQSMVQPQNGYTNVTISNRVARSVSAGSGSGVMGVRGGGGGKYGKVKSSAGTYITFGDFKGGGTAKSGVDITRWAQDFLREVGAPITLANMEAISAWIAAEGTAARFNPLAVISEPTAEAMGGTSNLDGWTDFNSHTVKNFANYQQGLKMNAYHIKKHGKGVIKALKSSTNNPYDIISAIEKMVDSWAPDYAARDVLESRNVPTSLSGGDPAGPPQLAQMSGGGTAAVSVTGGPTFNISPNIVMSGSGSPQDLQKIAKEVAALIRKEIEMQSLRRS